MVLVRNSYLTDRRHTDRDWLQCHLSTASPQFRQHSMGKAGKTREPSGCHVVAQRKHAVGSLKGRLTSPENWRFALSSLAYSRIQYLLRYRQTEVWSLYGMARRIPSDVPVRVRRSAG